MRTVSVLSQKGGAGKSTIAINLAAIAFRKKQRVLLLDLDPQATSLQWYEQRAHDKLSVLATEAKRLPEILKHARNDAFDWVFIDTSGRDEPGVNAAVKQSDFCLLPCRPSPADLHAIKPTVAGIRRMDKPFAFVITQAPARGNRADEARKALATLGDVAPKPIVIRAAYQDAYGRGGGRRRVSTPQQSRRGNPQSVELAQPSNEKARPCLRNAIR